KTNLDLKEESLLEINVQLIKQTRFDVIGRGLFTLSPNESKVVATSFIVNGRGKLEANAKVVKSSSLDLIGSTTLYIIPVKILNGSIDFKGTGCLYIHGGDNKIVISRIDFTSKGSFTADALRIVNTRFDVNAKSTFSISAKKILSTGFDIKGTGQFEVYPKLIAITSLSFKGIGRLIFVDGEPYYEVVELMASKDIE